MKHSLKDDRASTFEQQVLVRELGEKLGIKTETGHEFLLMALANAMLFDRKQQDYGSRNINGFGTLGCLVRMNDKMERIKHLFNVKGRKTVAVNESIADSYRDISNYAIIALMLEEDVWPK